MANLPTLLHILVPGLSRKLRRQNPFIVDCLKWLSRKVVWRCGGSLDNIGSSLVELHTTEAVVPGSNPVSLRTGIVTTNIVL